MSTTAVDFSKTYTVAGYGGVAFRAFGMQTETVGDWTFVGEDDDDRDDESLYVYDEEERETGMVLAHMVGDDRTFVVDADDLTEMDEDDYCHECGQVGCKGDGR